LSYFSGRSPRAVRWWLSFVILALFVPQGLASATPRAPVTLVVGIPNDPTSLDAHWQIDVQGTVIFPTLYDRLVQFDKNSNIVPELALRWNTSPDLRTWTFYLRGGQKFHDGTPVTADAIKRNFERFLDPKNQFVERSRYSQIQYMVAVDDTTLVFKLGQPDPFFPNLMADPLSSIVSPTAAAAVDPKTFGRRPVGSGPYVFQEWIPGEKIVLRKNPSHWLASTSNVDAIEFRTIPESVSRTLGVETGELDFATFLDPAQIQSLKGKAGVAVYNDPGPTVIALLPNHKRPILKDARVRQAIAYAIDKNVLVNQVMLGAAEIADAPIPRGIWPHKSQPVFKYDLHRAAELLAAAGYGSGFSANLIVPVGRISNSRQVAEAVAGMLQKARINVTLEPMEHTAWRFRMRGGPEKANFDLSIFLWQTQTGEANYGMKVTMATPNWSPECCNWGYYSNPEVDSLFERAFTVRGDAERRAAYEQAQAIVWKDQAWIFLFFPNQLSAGRSSVKGIKVLPVGTYQMREVTKSQ
jgi:glutathione transport system substrate-binding protein